MQPRVRYGLIAGGIGLLLNICVAGLVGVCGPVLALLAGGAAGFFASREEQASTQSDGARVGAISGAIAGGLVLLGQVIGGVAILAVAQAFQLQPPIGSMPTPGDALGQTFYWFGGAGVAICFGLVGVALAAGAGAAAGYFSTPSEQMPAV